MTMERTEAAVIRTMSAKAIPKIFRFIERENPGRARNCDIHVSELF